MTAATESYPGELAMLRGVLGVVRVTAKYGDIAELRRIVAEFDIDEQAAYAEQDEKATAAATTATPPITGRLAHLLEAVRTRGGEWSTAKVQALYRRTGPEVPLRATARKDLHALHAMGHLVHHHERGRQFYTLNNRADGAR